MLVDLFCLVVHSARSRAPNKPPCLDALPVRRIHRRSMHLLHQMIIFTCLSWSMPTCHQPGGPLLCLRVAYSCVSFLFLGRSSSFKRSAIYNCRLRSPFLSPHVKQFTSKKMKTVALLLLALEGASAFPFVLDQVLNTPETKRGVTGSGACSVSALCNEYVEVTDSQISCEYFLDDDLRWVSLKTCVYTDNGIRRPSESHRTPASE